LVRASPESKRTQLGYSPEPPAWAAVVLRRVAGPEGMSWPLQVLDWSKH